MRMSWLLCVLVTTLAWGQAMPGGPPTAQPGAPAAPDTSASVPANAAVITIEGVCPPAAKPATAKGAAADAAKPATKTSPAKMSGAGCKTVITKAEFEKLANNLAPNITPQMKKQLAGVLPRLIAMSAEAKKEGLENTPQFKERVKFNRMQVLAQQLQQKIQEQAAKVPDAEVEKYYKEHPEGFEQYNVDRIFVPRTKQESAETKNEEKASEDKSEKLTPEQEKAKQDAEKAKGEQGEQDMTKLAEDLRARAAKGEDFVKLQKEAFDAAGMKIESPTVNLPSVRRSGLPPAHSAVFDLKQGDVSPVISDSGGHYIYKLNNKSEMPLEQAKTEIHSKLQNDRQKEKMDAVNSSFKVETNEAYFGPGGASPMPQRPTRPRPGMPTGMQRQAPPAAQPQTPPASQAPESKPN